MLQNLSYIWVNTKCDYKIEYYLCQKKKRMNYFSSNFKLGILGGGQLGKMLLFETRKFDIYTKVLDPSIDAPSKIACNEFVQGDLMDFDTVYQFGKQVDVLTFEIELVNILALEQLEAEGILVYPSSKTLKYIQNKGVQKDFYVQNNIPTAAFRRFDNLTILKELAKNQNISLPFIWKSAEFGYDGNGVKMIRAIKDLDSLPNVACIAEDVVDFEKELAVIVCRNAAGNFKTYPVVEMEFHPEANQVEYVICPANIKAEISKKAIDIALMLAQKMDVVGLLAVEMFLTADESILVNEVAPRPHNSGHFSIEASFTSQFENHIRAVLNLPLGCCDSKLPAVMVNLVGETGFAGNVIYENMEKILSLDGVCPHIYGKMQTRAFRKMGHVTIVNQDAARARLIAAEVKLMLRVVGDVDLS